MVRGEPQSTRGPGWVRLAPSPLPAQGGKARPCGAGGECTPWPLPGPRLQRRAACQAAGRTGVGSRGGPGGALCRPGGRSRCLSLPQCTGAARPPGSAGGKGTLLMSGEGHGGDRLGTGDPLCSGDGGDRSSELCNSPRANQHHPQQLPGGNPAAVSWGGRLQEEARVWYCVLCTMGAAYGRPGSSGDDVSCLLLALSWVRCI